MNETKPETIDLKAIHLKSKSETENAGVHEAVTSKIYPIMRTPSTSAPVGVTVMGTAYCLPTAPAIQYAAIYPSLISAVMVIAGWIVVNKAQANRERRKQIREYVADLRSDLDDLEKLVIDYHTSAREIANEREIISKLGRFEKAFSSLPRFLSSQSVFKALKQEQLEVNDENLQKLRKAMTLAHFADEHLGALSAQHERIQGVEFAAEVVQEDLESVRIAALD